MNKHEYTIMILQHIQFELIQCSKVAEQHTEKEIKETQHRNEILASLFALYMVNNDTIERFIKREKYLLERGED